MPRVKPNQTKDGFSDLEARIITAIGSAGPRNIAQISRMTGTHQETIRYKIKKRFARLGFKFHAEVDFDKLGLGLHWGTLYFTNAFYDSAPQVLRVLNRVGYLTYYAKVLPQGSYIGLFALPQGTPDQYKVLLSELTSEGVLSGFTFDEVLASKHKAMNPQFFDFRSGRWEIDWARVPDQISTPLQIGKRAQAVNFDLYDLLIIKELQRDSLQHLTGIAKKLKVHQKTLEYHYRTHVQKCKMIPSYRVSWAQDTSNRPARSTVTTRLTFHDLSKQRLSEVQGSISRVPFLWAEDLLQSGTYVATLHVPVTELLGVSSYINESVRGLDSKVDVGFIKSADTSSFTVPYGQYGKGGWRFDIQEMKSALRIEATALLQK